MYLRAAGLKETAYACHPPGPGSAALGPPPWHQHGGFEAGSWAARPQRLPARDGNQADHELQAAAWRGYLATGSARAAHRLASYAPKKTRLTSFAATSQYMICPHAALIMWLCGPASTGCMQSRPKCELLMALQGYSMGGGLTGLSLNLPNTDRSHSHESVCLALAMASADSACSPIMPVSTVLMTNSKAQAKIGNGITRVL